MMSDSQPLGWEPLLASVAPKGCALAAALFTTYDRAEERLLAENLLPELLQLSHEADGETAERKYFSLELNDRLKQLHGRIVLVSSTQREEANPDEEAAGDGMYGWIWRSIRQLTVGKTGRAVQHAKLWLLHWEHSEGGQYLEIVVSSANLTRAAFRQQIQAAWRVCLALGPPSAKSKLDDWSILPEFLRALAVSAGDDTHIKKFISLLARADCPPGIGFVASVPGKHPQTALWGAGGLRNIMPAGRGAVKAWVLVPFVGAWTKESLQQWCSQFDGKPNGLSLVWIDKNHAWVPHWLLPTTTLKHLATAGCTLLQLVFDTQRGKRTDHFHDEHRVSDARWSHAKVYAFRRGNSRRLMLTSANFSQAAWGTPAPNGGLDIENFELGVCIAQSDWPFDHLKKFEDHQDVATSPNMLLRSSRLISWAQASWDGASVLLECKCQRELAGQVLSGKEPLPIIFRKADANGMYTAQIQWTDAEQIPKSVWLTCGAETLNVPVFDDRPLAARESSFPDNISEADAQAMLDQLLFERYGGKAATDDEADFEQTSKNAVFGKAGKPLGDSGATDSYAVPAFVDARQHLQTVDTWASRIAQAKQGGSEFALEVLQRDGQLLMAAFSRRDISGNNETGARLAAEELALRLKHGV
jgi:hypothetical protein